MDCIFLKNLLLEEEEYVFDIHTAASIGCDELIVSILKAEPGMLDKANGRGWTPLMLAGSLAHPQTVALLLKEGADVHKRNHQGQSALIATAKSGSAQVVAMLLEAGAESEDRDSKGCSAVGHAAKFGYRSVIQLLVEKGASVDSADKEGITPLMLASAAGHEMVVKDLLKLGANVHLQSKSGDTARSLAARKGHSKLTSLLESRRNCGLQSLLQELRLSKYFPLFEKQEIDLDAFWTLNEGDLKEIGIQIVGPRKALCNAIAEQHQKMACGNDPQALRILNSQLLLEIRRLKQANEELESKAYREAELRREAEKSLTSGIESLKNFSGVVLRTMSHSVQLQERLRQTLVGLKRGLPSVGGQSLLPLLAHAEKLAGEILRQSQLSLQQTSFRS